MAAGACDLSMAVGWRQGHLEKCLASQPSLFDERPCLKGTQWRATEVDTFALSGFCMDVLGMQCILTCTVEYVKHKEGNYTLQKARK